MAQRQHFEELRTHNENLWSAIKEVGKIDKRLEDKLTDEYRGVLQATLEVLDDVSKVLEHQF